MARYLFILSFDALGAKDLEDIESLPNFKIIKETGTHIKKSSFDLSFSYIPSSYIHYYGTLSYYTWNCE
ncbi:hypothetical protein MCOL2_08176 [Listeria fleischmannii FSL S10-1203]|uniref:Uncharacterized protein n=1 Tax=Listeria fleischmannii FSL S10-1203 TaxID=1265822 RepID=W7DMJ4_9LIST|nr:hypothetical protein MCOL2_08176 [Listeria fleischmannii FSL S10-1203]